MTHPFLSLRPMAASLALLVACVPPPVDPGGEGDTDPDAATGSTGGPAADDEGGAGTGSDPGADSDPAGSESGDETAGPADEGGSTGEPEPTGTDDGGPVETCDPITHVCLTAAPADWSGPVAIVEGDSAGPPLACAPGYPVFLDLDLNAVFSDGGPAACACDCNVSGDAACHVEANLSFWDPGYGVTETDACQMTPDGAVQVDEGLTIYNNPPWVDDPGGVWRVNYSVQEIGGSCNPTGSQSIPTAGFETRVTACALHDEPAACGEGGVCAPRPAAPYEGRLCIWQEGEHACPAEGEFVEPYVYHGGIEDTRSCLDCTCGDLQGSCTDESFTIGYFNFLAGLFNIAWDDEQIPLDGSCETIALQQGQTHNAMQVEAGDLTNPSCAADPGTNQVQGAVAPIEPVTFCCAPI